MKLKTLVLIGSLIAFSSCEKEEEITINMNELSLDSRLFGNWFRIIDGSGEISYSSDGRCILNTFIADYFVVRNQNSALFEGRIIYVPNDNNTNSFTHDYHFNGDTLVIDDSQKWLKY